MLKINFRKFLTVLTIFCSLSFIAPSTTIFHPAQVQASYRSRYWFRKHKIVTTRRVRATEISGDFLRKRHPVIRHRTLKKGTHMTITRGGTSLAVWAILNKRVKGLGRVYTRRGNFWVINIRSIKWFRLA